MNKLLFALRHTPVIYWALIPTMPGYVAEFPKGEMKGNFKIDIDLQTSMGRRSYKSYSFRGNLQQAYVSARITARKAAFLVPEQFGVDYTIVYKKVLKGAVK